MYTYRNGNYRVFIGKDGTKIRKTEEDEFLPQFAENCDVKITDKCIQNCSFCYEGCTREGKHGDLLGYTNFLNSLHPYTELALNGNDLDHPQLEEFLKILKDKKVFANITVNQNQLKKGFATIMDYQKKGLIHGIGVSLVHIDTELISMLHSLNNTVLHTIVGILSPEDIEQLKDKNLRILLLGYKQRGRGIIYKAFHNEFIDKNTEYLQNILPELFKSFKLVSFDNLALEQLDVKRFLTDKEWETFYMGDDGNFTFYIDLVKGEFAKNSVSDVRYPIGNRTIDEMFYMIQTKY